MNANNVTPDDRVPDDADLGAPTEDAVVVKGSAATEVADSESVVVSDAVVSDVVASDALVDDAAVSDAAVSDAAATSEISSAPMQTVYVTAPTPPKRKGNRGMGALLAVVATIVFAAVYVGAAAALTLFVNPNGVVSAVSTFLTNPLFYIPVLVFLVMMILWALLANRASWWSWVIGSLVIGLVTYFASIGAFLLMEGGFGLTASAASARFTAFAMSPAMIAAALIARETSIWFGAAIAKRGRRVRERNYESWQAFENEEARKRAEFGGVAAD